MAHHRRCGPQPPPLLLLLIASVWFRSCPLCSASSPHEFPVDGTVLELDDSNFDSAISAFDFILVDFYAPWCGHCKRLSPELDAAAPVLASLKEPIVVAKLDADKYRKLASKYEIDGYPTLKLFMHGIPIEYSGPRKAELLVRFLRKFVAPNVSILEHDSGVREFVEKAGTNFPIFIGFGLNESVIADFGGKYKKKAWFSAVKDFSEELMVTYDFDKVPALVSLHPKYNEHSVFYGPFEGEFLEDFIKQNQLPLSVPINQETLLLLNDDKRKIVLTIVEDEFDEKALKLINVLKAAASANRDLVFAYVGVKQWVQFAETFDANTKTKLPKVLIWNVQEEYFIDEGLESLDAEDDQGSQISRFLKTYRDGKLVQKSISGPSFSGFVKSLINIRTAYLIIFIVVVLMLILYMGGPGDEGPQSHHRSGDCDSSSSAAESEREQYGPEDKED